MEPASKKRKNENEHAKYKEFFKEASNRAEQFLEGVRNIGIYNEKEWEHLQTEQNQLEKEKEEFEEQRKDLKEDLRKEREMLQREKDQVRKKMIEVQEFKELMNNVSSSSKSKLKLNIGGHVFTTSISTLTSVPGCMFQGKDLFISVILTLINKPCLVDISIRSQMMTVSFSLIAIPNFSNSF